MSVALAPAVVRPVPAQVADIQRLLAGLEARGKDLSGTRAQLNRCWVENAFSVDFAADMIKMLLGLREELDRAAVVDAPSVAVPIPSGRYAVPAEAGHLAFYRVWEGDYATLVFLQVSDNEQRLSRSAARTVLAKIAEGPLEASKAYGREIGCCGVCGRTLTNEESRSLGIGPVCRARF